MWLLLTSHDGTQLRVNMSVAADYFTFVGEGGNTFISNTVDKDGYHVKETVEQIDDALRNANSPLRVVKPSRWDS